MDYATFKAMRAPHEARENAAGKAYSGFPGAGSGPMGLTPDHIRTSPAFRAVYAEWCEASARIAAFDKAFTRAHRKTWPVYFKREICAERDARRADVLAGRRLTLTGEA